MSTCPLQMLQLFELTHEEVVLRRELLSKRREQQLFTVSLWYSVLVLSMLLKLNNK